MDQPAPAHPTVTLWNGFDAESPQRSRLPIFFGVPMPLMDDMMFLGAARSRPAARLVARTPDLMRHLSHQTVVTTERCIGHVRGPIQWSETITAWSSGVGVNDVFVCGSPRRDFDVPENRLVVWLLKRLAAASRRSHGDAAAWFDAAEIERVQEQGRQAQRLLSHPSLRGIPARKLTGREWRDIRKSRHLQTYTPALRLADRVQRPFGSGDVVALASPTAQEHHRVILLLLEAVRAHGHAVPMLSVRGDFMVSGLLRYRNPYVMVDRRVSGENGLYYGDLRLRTRAEDPAQQPEGTTLVENRDDARRVVERVIAARRERPAESAAPAVTFDGPTEDVQSSASGLVQLPGSYSS